MTHLSDCAVAMSSPYIESHWQVRESHTMARICAIEDVERLEQVPLSERIKERSLYDVLSRSAGRFGDAIAISWLPTGDPDEPSVDWTYGEVFATVNRVARLYRAVGVRQKDAVALLLPDLPETLVASWAAEVAGIATPLNPYLEVEILASLMEAAGARVMVACGAANNEDLWKKALRAARRAKGVETIIAVGGGSRYREGDIEVRPWRDAEAMSSEVVPWHRDLGPELIAAYFHTGGTTAAPKLAMQLHGNQLYMIWAIAEVLDYHPTDCELVGLPLYHVNAAIGSAMVVLATGGRIVLLGPNGYRNRKLIQGFWRVVDRFRATIISAVPTVYAALLDVPLGDADVSSLRYAVCGAAPIPVEVFRRFVRHSGVAIVEGYGLTEGTLVSAVNPLYGEKRVGSVGLRFPYQSIDIVEVSGTRRCAPGEVGRVCLRGPNVFPGFCDSRHDHNAWLEPGVLDTGDLGRLDEDGYLWLCGRTKELIIRGGHNIDPAMIEEALCSHPAVRFAAAVGRPDAHAGEIPQAYVELRSGQMVTAQELLEFSEQTIPERAARPKVLRILDSLPTTDVGKIAKTELRVLATREAVDECLAVLGAEASELGVEVSLGSSGIEVAVGDCGPIEEAKRLLERLPLVIVG